MKKKQATWGFFTHFCLAVMGNIRNEMNENLQEIIDLASPSLIK